ncbi:SIS domain-containing protein [Bacillus sp. FJAT-50079]|uniref:SIS domain-containing protein n=1 Tax=Bacillus sp. FJAT-50079 TaxID=2833577 RepID=UPI001BC947BA|nr:SIS domain-containing protein [Bacillus sp. FJAT-50079]MBS4206566.1 SIS domain-containing protein [Bacillus sp. FJAT-50079]
MDMINTIERIPVQLNKILNNKVVIEKNLLDYLKADSKVKKIVFIASGTSYNAAFTTKTFAEEFTGIPVEIIYPNIFVNYYNHSLLNDETLYIFISQGGKTKLVYDALEIVKAKGFLNISITESLDSPIAKLSDLPLEMGSENEEYIFRTLGYSATCATLYWIFISIGKIYDGITESMEQFLIEDYLNMVNNLPGIRNTTLKWYEQNKFQLMQKNKFIFSGTNDLWAVSQEADIKFMEMLPVFTNSFELEELIHGPQNAFDSMTGYFLLSRKDEDSDKIERISDFINTEISQCMVVGEGTSREVDLSFSPRSKYFSSLEYITVFQVLAYQLSTDKGRDLTKGVYPQITKYINKFV